MGGYADIHSDVTVVWNERSKFVFVFDRNEMVRWKKDKKQAMTRSLFLPSYIQWHSGQEFRGTVYFTGFWGGLAYGIHSYVQYDEEDKKLNDLIQQSSGPNSGIDQIQDAQTQKDKYEDQWRTAGLVVAASYVLQLIDGLLFGGGPDPIVYAGVGDSSPGGANWNSGMDVVRAGIRLSF